MNQYTELELAALRPSPTNPRKTFEQSELESLSDSIKVQGVIQPIVVRINNDLKLISDEVPNVYEIVSGERRYRASVLAGKETIPAIVRTLSDEQVLEIQIVENLQRQDVDPIEEAEAFTFLHENYKNFTSEEIALRVGKSVSYVRTRMQLCKLCVRAKKLLKDKTITIGHCTLLSKLSVDDQEKVLKWMIDDDCDEENPVIISVSDVSDTKDYIKRNFFLDLANAKFDTKDAKLFSEAGSCHLCPKRTGYNLNLFEDLDNKDRCMDSKCYNIKLDNHVEKYLKKKYIGISTEDKEGCVNEWDITDITEVNNEAFSKDLIKNGIIVDGASKGEIIKFVHDDDAYAIDSHPNSKNQTSKKSIEKKWNPNDYFTKEEIKVRIQQTVIASELSVNHNEVFLYILRDALRALDEALYPTFFSTYKWDIIDSEDQITDDLDLMNCDKTVIRNCQKLTDAKQISILYVLWLCRMVDRGEDQYQETINNILNSEGIKTEDITEEYRLEWEEKNGRAEE